MFKNKKCPTQICWSCKWATSPKENPCTWSKSLIPVEGWEAENEIRVMRFGNVYRDVESVYIKHCPLYERG